ncbi:MAG TPA: glycosyltransferase family 4 protein [Rhodothermales bacterium]|nr:glycosyltransferase family 4 protein [Rhodothermales bacterium]
MKPIKILTIGPLPPPIGGATVLFKVLVDALARRRDVEVRVLPLPSGRDIRISDPWRLLQHVIGLFRYTPQSDVVSLHCNPTGIHVRAALVSAAARLFGKPLVIRTFGGQAPREGAGRVTPEQFIRALKRADLYLGESQHQVQDAREAGIPRAEWFPNHRPVPPIGSVGAENGHDGRRFVFLSHVSAGKGIPELIEAGERFGSDVRIDVYGPFDEGMTEAVFEGCRQVCYRGVIEPDGVVEVLRQYDALVLPTSCSTEGYPGIIIEAYSVGLPVISTRLGRLPELVDQSSGILVEPQNAEALYQAIKLLVDDPKRLARLRKGALEKRETYDVEFWSERFVQLCRETVENRQSHGRRKPE